MLIFLSSLWEIKTDVHFLLGCLSLDHTCLDLPSLTSKNMFSFVRDSKLLSSVTYCYISEYKLFKAFSIFWKWNNLMTRFFGARLVAVVVARGSVTCQTRSQAWQSENNTGTYDISSQGCVVEPQLCKSHF